MNIAHMALALVLFSTAPVFAQGSHPDLLAGPSGLNWGPAPPTFPKGAQIAVLSGDPSKSAPYVVRLRMPANYQIPAHHHPTTENVTVLSGSFYAGMGDKLNQKNAQAFEPGGFVSMPANMNHYAWATSETVIQVHGEGPFAITYVNPADDPSKAQ
jgi:quercetin dioxygenase-like cupin family protein